MNPAGRAFTDCRAKPLPRYDVPAMTRENPAPLRVALVDDQATLRKALASLLESTSPARVVVAGDHSDETISQLDHKAIQVVLVGFDAQTHDPAATVRRALQQSPELPICALVVAGQSHKVLDALAAGCRGAVSADATIESLSNALRTIAAGQSYVDPSLSGELLARGYGFTDRNGHNPNGGTGRSGPRPNGRHS